VEAVVFTCALSDRTDYVHYITSSSAFYRAYDSKGRESEVEGQIPIGRDTFVTYVRPSGTRDGHPAN
jgi:hypothetical protein